MEGASQYCPEIIILHEKNKQPKPLRMQVTLLYEVQ
jgi:hypothetical protein